MSLNRKQIIANSFGRNIHTYETNAKIQNEVAQKLCDLIDTDTPPANILEIGCGTGFLTEKLINKFPDAHVTAIDISQEMVNHCEAKFKNIKAIQMDGETLKLNQKFDLIISNLSIQWFENPISGIEEIKAYLAPKGELYYSTIGKNNFQEWKDTLDKLSLPNGLIKVPDYEDIIQEELIKKNYPSAKDFLKSLQKIGAHQPTDGYKKLTAIQMQKACSEFDRTYSGTISWHILYGHFQRL